MNAHMAEGTTLVLRIQHVMRAGLKEDAQILTAKGSRAVVAFEAKREYYRTAQQLRVHRAMREMTALAAFDTNAGALEDKGTAFIDMPFATRLFVVEAGLQHSRIRDPA